MVPSSRAAASASSSTMPPRAAFTSSASGFIAAKAFSSKRYSVDSTSGAWMLMKSERFSSSANSTSSTSRLAASSFDMTGSAAMTFMCRP